MAEQLASLYKKGGGTIDYLNPDKTVSGNIQSTATTNVAVTQKPRLIIESFNTYNSTEAYRILVVVDVIKDDGIRILVNNDGTLDVSPLTAVATYFPTISNSVVTIKNPSSTRRFYYTTTMYY